MAIPRIIHPRTLTRAELADPGSLSQDERACQVPALARYWGIGHVETKRRLFDLYLIDEGRIGKGDLN